MEHTPGPWFFAKCPNSRGYFVTDSEPLDDEGRCGFGSNMIADVHHVSTGDHHRANAQLIAAAPDLLEACIAMQRTAKNSIARDVAERMMAEAVAKTTATEG